MYRVLTKGWWLTTTIVVLLVGGSFAAIGQQQQVEARDQLRLLDVAHYNLALVSQAAIDDALGQQSLAFTAGDSAALDQHADYLRSLTDLAEPGLVEWRSSVDAVTEGHGDLRSVSVALDRLVGATVPPVRAEQRAAGHRVLWSLAVTGVLVAVLAVIEFRRPEE